MSEQDCTDEELRIDQVPTESRWHFQTLYIESSVKGILSWTIGFDGDSTLVINHGTLDGERQVDHLLVITNQTGRSLKEQALSQARQRYLLKWRAGYRTANSPVPVIMKPMAAQEYKIEDVSYPVYTQPKLDGIRMLIGSDLSPRSRSGLAYPHLNHLIPVITELMGYLPAHTILDGEMYSHGLALNKIASAMSKKTPPYSQYLLQLEYWIFDIVYDSDDGAPFERRHRLLRDACARWSEDGGTGPLRLVPCHLAEDDQAVHNNYQYYLSQNYEGAMIRCLSNNAPPGSEQYQRSLYKCGRSNHILKLKPFLDEEVEVVGVTPASGRESLLAMLLVRDNRNNTLTIRMAGNSSRRRRWLSHPEEIVGKMVTMRYSRLSEYGVPLAPRGIAVRDYE